MSVDRPLGEARSFAYLLRLTGAGPLVRVGVLMILSSATEGIGLVLLVPIVAAGVGQPLAGTNFAWLARLGQQPLWLLLAAFVILVAVRALIMLAVTTERHAMGLALTRKLRIAAQEAILAAEWRWLSGQRSSDHAALIVGEADRVGHQVDRALDLVTSLVTLVALLAAAFWLEWRLTLLTLGLGGVLALAALALRREREAHGDQLSSAFERLQGHVDNGLAHLRAARIAGAQTVLERDFGDVATSLETIEARHQFVTDRIYFVLQLCAALVLAALAWIGLRVLAVPLALFVPVTAIFVRIAPLLGNLQQGWRAWRFSRPALDRLLAKIAAARAASEPRAVDGPPIPFAETISLDDVGLRFAGREAPVFDRFSHAIPHGSVVAITGPSGSGKSTLADLLSGLLAPDNGAIRVDGLALAGEARIRWRRQVAYVEQVPFLIDGTIADNLAWGLDGVAREAMESALHGASALFVFDLPHGLDTRVGESGRALSGGERQRISFARALLRRPSLIILDEVTAALDAHNEEAVARTVAAMRGDCTFVILGHRPALHALADLRIELAGD